MPPMYPLMLVLYRRGCGITSDSACRRAGHLLPLTDSLALRPPPLAEVSFEMFHPAQMFFASYADCFV